MLSESSQIDKGLEFLIRKSGLNLPHCSQNSTKMEGKLVCWKCKEARTRGKVKDFDNTKSYYFHLKTKHNDIDRDCYPSIDNCIETLQIISDLISIGVLK